MRQKAKEQSRKGEREGESGGDRCQEAEERRGRMMEINGEWQLWDRGVCRVSV